MAIFGGFGGMGSAPQAGQEQDSGWQGIGALMGMGGEDPRSAAKRQMFLNGFRTQVGQIPQFGEGVPQAAAQGFQIQRAKQQDEIAEQERAEAAQAKTELAAALKQQLPANLHSMIDANPEMAMTVWKQMQPNSQALMNAGDGQIYNPNTGEWITSPNANASMTDTQQNLMWRAEQAGLQPGTPEYQQFMVSGGSGGTSLSVGPDGSVSFVQGAGAKALTEGQSKDAVYATRAAGALPMINKFGHELTNPAQRAMEMDPTGVVRGQQTPEFQQAKQAGDEFLQAILRKDTGAAITPSEMSEYGRVYLPQPGDSPELLAQKATSRVRALEALKAGMPPQGILNMEQAILNTGNISSISTKEQYDALPSGARYVAPDGQLRTKQ